MKYSYAREYKESATYINSNKPELFALIRFDLLLIWFKGAIFYGQTETISFIKTNSLRIHPHKNFIWLHLPKRNEKKKKER